MAKIRTKGAPLELGFLPTGDEWVGVEFTVVDDTGAECVVLRDEAVRVLKETGRPDRVSLARSLAKLGDICTHLVFNRNSCEPA